MLRVLKSPEGGYSHLSQRESFDSVRGVQTSEEQIDKPAWERSESADNAMRLLTLAFVEHLHGLFGNNTLFARKSHKLDQWCTVPQLGFTVPALPLLLANFENEIAHLLQNERLAKSRAEVVEIDDKKKCRACREVFRGRALLLKGLVSCVRRREAGSSKRNNDGLKEERAIVVDDIGSKKRAKPRRAVKAAKKTGYRKLNVKAEQHGWMKRT